MIEIDVPGFRRFRLEHLVLDVNGTIARDGQLLEGVRERVEALRSRLALHLVTADTHGRQAEIDKLLSFSAVRIPIKDQAQAKRSYIETLGPDTVAAFGNGANDAAMLKGAALGVCVLGPEGSALEALREADVVVPDIRAAFELLLYPKRLIATLRR